MNASFRFLIGNDFIGSVIFVKTQCRLNVGFTVSRASLGYDILVASDLFSSRVHLFLQALYFDNTLGADSRIYALVRFSRGHKFHAVWTVSRVHTWITINCHGLLKVISLTWQCLHDMSSNASLILREYPVLNQDNRDEGQSAKDCHSSARDSPDYTQNLVTIIFKLCDQLVDLTSFSLLCALPWSTCLNRCQCCLQFGVNLCAIQYFLYSSLCYQLF